MKIFKILIAFTFIAGLGALVVTGCGRHHHDPDEKAEWVVNKVSRKLDLNDEQKAKLEEVKVEFMKHHKAHRQQRIEMLDKLMLEVKKPEIDKTVLTEMVNQHKSHVDEMAPSVIEKLAQFHASLNDAQKNELAEKLEKFKKHHQD